MGLIGKVIGQTEIKSDGHLFYESWRYRPNQISYMSPGNLQGVEIYEGEWGTVGSRMIWSYTFGGEKKVTRDIVEAVDDEKKSITWKLVEGSLLDLYKTMIITVDVDTKGKSSVVTWTFEYEKLNEDVEDANALVDFHLVMTKDIEAYHLRQK
ncbi:unnamed protein product [Ilex paraguariensis]|uniref:Bet v I/Major latex protein domain-containing protein n=1 Tax=Ilex paraguariensis TaxID=185542 RepID=A0ABC8UGX5_9AQUA